MTEVLFHKELERGDILDGAYRIVRLIAQGGMGYVYEADQLRLDRKVALKILSVDPKKSGEFLPRFRREAEICAKLSHPNIIAVLDWNVTHGMPYMVMELLEGEDLGFRLQQGPMSFADALPLIGDIAAGLTAAHAHGVVHRDLKPSNIYLCNVGGPRPHVKLLDFGVSKVTWETTLSTTAPKVLGSPRYMAPEQARGDANIDARVDQFALGAVIYEILSGRFAFDGESLTTVLYRVVHEQPKPLNQLAPNVPAHVVATVERAMAKDPAARFQDVAQMMQALRGEVPADVPHPRALPTAQAQALKPDAGVTLLVDLAKVKKGRSGLYIGAAVATVALAAAVWRFQPRGDAPAPLPATAIADATTADPPPPPPPPPPPAEVEPAPDPTPPTTNTPPTTTARPETVTKPKVPVKESAAVKSLLDEAQDLYDTGKYDLAVERARQALNREDTPRAHLLVALAYCQLSSLGDVRAELYSVRPADRPQVVKACKGRGIDL